jgi:hypothetical protein
MSAASLNRASALVRGISLMSGDGFHDDGRNENL